MIRASGLLPDRRGPNVRGTRPQPISKVKNHTRSLLAMAAILAAVSCATTEPPKSGGAAAPAPADYAALAAASAGRVYAIDPAASRIRIYVFRGGRAAFAGHNHVLTAQRFSGMAYLPDKGTAQARFDLQFALDQLVVDAPELRQEAGPAFSTTLDADAVKGTRDHMLGPHGLDAARFPTVAVDSAGIVGELPHVVATVALTLHGQTRQFLIPLDVTTDGGRLRVNGAFALRQTDFGVTPYSVMGGLLAVQDEVSIDFSLAGTPAGFSGKTEPQ